MRQPDRQERTCNPKCSEQSEDRDQRHLQRNDQQRNHGQKDPLAASEFHPRKGVRSERSYANGDHRSWNGDEEAVDEAGCEVVTAQNALVVLERELERRRKRRPPRPGQPAH